MLRAIAQDERSQLRNRELAIERLVAALRDALHVAAAAACRRSRRAAAKARPLDEKKRRGEIKRLRRQPPD